MVEAPTSAEAEDAAARIVRGASRPTPVRDAEDGRAPRAPRLARPCADSSAWCGAQRRARRPSWRRSFGCSTRPARASATRWTAPDAVVLHEAAGAVADRRPHAAGPTRRRGRCSPIRSRWPRSITAPSEITAHLVAIEATLDAAAATDADAEVVEARNAALVACKDAVWALQWDRLGTARAIEDLAAAGSDRAAAALSAYYSIQVTLSALDRLEVRGRDSAGLHVLVTGHGLDLADADVARLIAARSVGPAVRGAVRCASPTVNSAFVYKTAAEIGELGDNTARIARADPRRRSAAPRAAIATTAQAAVLAHTRWASVGIISEPNAHPLEPGGARRRDGAALRHRRAQR